MKEFIIALLITLGLMSPTIEAVPPEVNTEGLCYYEAVETVAYDERDAIALAKMLYGEARGCTADDQRNCCIVACNRAEDGRWPDSVYDCVTQRDQFYGYDPAHPVLPELYAVAVEVLIDWPSHTNWADFNHFSGDGVRNYFYTR